MSTSRGRGFSDVWGWGSSCMWGGALLVCGGEFLTCPSCPNNKMQSCRHGGNGGRRVAPGRRPPARWTAPAACHTIMFPAEKLQVFPTPRGGSSTGRARRSQCRGWEFDPPPLHSSYGCAAIHGPCGLACRRHGQGVRGPAGPRFYLAGVLAGILPKVLAGMVAGILAEIFARASSWSAKWLPVIPRRS